MMTFGWKVTITFSQLDKLTELESLFSNTQAPLLIVTDLFLEQSAAYEASHSVRKKLGCILKHCLKVPTLLTIINL